MGRKTQKALIKYLGRRHDRYPDLWVTEEQTPLRAEGIATAVKRLCERASVTGVKRGPHTFRHTAAITYLRNGGPEKTLQIMLGHSTRAMTDHYVDSMGEDDMIRAHRLASPADRLLKND